MVIAIAFCRTPSIQLYLHRGRKPTRSQRQFDILKRRQTRENVRMDSRLFTHPGTTADKYVWPCAANRCTCSVPRFLIGFGKPPVKRLFSVSMPTGKRALQACDFSASKKFSSLSKCSYWPEIPSRYRKTRCRQRPRRAQEASAAWPVLSLAARKRKQHWSRTYSRPGNAENWIKVRH